MTIRKEDALEYHSTAPAGKLAVVATKPCRIQRDLSLAYTPGVAAPCLEIQRDPALIYKYTAKGNLVGDRNHKRPNRHKAPISDAGTGPLLRQGIPRDPF